MTRSTASRTSGRSCGRDARPGTRVSTDSAEALSRGLHELTQQARRIRASRELDVHPKSVADDRRVEVVERREDLPSRPLRGQPRELRDDEVLPAKTFRAHDLLLDLSGLASGELGFGPVQEAGDPRLALPAPLGYAVQVVARDVDASIAIREPEAVGGQDEIPRHRFVDRQAAPQALGEHPVVEVL